MSLLTLIGLFAGLFQDFVKPLFLGGVEPTPPTTRVNDGATDPTLRKPSTELLSIQLKKAAVLELTPDSDLAEMHLYFTFSNISDRPFSVSSIVIKLHAAEKTWLADDTLMALSGENPLPLRLDVSEVAEIGWRVFFWDEETSKVVTWTLAASKPDLEIEVTDNFGNIYRMEKTAFEPEAWDHEAVEAVRELQKIKSAS